jgi:hypothetical protein
MDFVVETPPKETAPAGGTGAGALLRAFEEPIWHRPAQPIRKP